MKRIYFATSFKYRDEYFDIYQKLKTFLIKKYNIELYSFVFEYEGSTDDYAMMKTDFTEMDKSD